MESVDDDSSKVCPSLYYPGTGQNQAESPELSRRPPQKCTRAPCFSAARGAGSARWVTPQPRDCVSMCDVLHVSLHLRLSIPH